MARHRSFDYEQARRLFEEGASLETIGQRFGVTPAAVRYAIRHAGCPPQSRTYDHDLIRRLDCEGATQAEIARRVGCTTACVWHVLGRARWRRPRGPERNRQQETYVIAERAKGRTLGEIGGDLQISAERVRQILRRAQKG